MRGKFDARLLQARFVALNQLFQAFAVARQLLLVAAGKIADGGMAEAQQVFGAGTAVAIEPGAGGDDALNLAQHVQLPLFAADLLAVVGLPVGEALEQVLHDVFLCARERE